MLRNHKGIISNSMVSCRNVTCSFNHAHVCRKTAANMCTDIPNTHGGLAMWISKDVFEWISTSQFSQAWLWVGAHTSPGKAPSGGRDNFAFGQGPTFSDMR